MRPDPSEAKRILVISLTNIGDVILTFPVLDAIAANYPDSKISILIGPKAESLLSRNPLFDKVLVFDKRAGIGHKFGMLKTIRNGKYDMIIDLRNSVFPVFSGAKFRNSLIAQKYEGMHMRQKHLKVLEQVVDCEREADDRKCVYISEQDEARARSLTGGGEYAVMAPGAAAHEKHWSAVKYAGLADRIIREKNMRVVLVGDKGDVPISEKVQGLSQQKLIDVTGATTLTELAAILKHGKFAITNDSAPMHLSSYLNLPVIAMFGPSDPLKYGPWSQYGYFFNAMKVVEVDQVFQKLP